jgi:outer membrane protein assembly factor BamB
MRLALILLVLSIPIVPVAAEENWPQFRGPRGAGHADAAGLPIQWSETENVRWKTAIHGKGWSSPVIWGEQIWLTTARPEGDQMFAICVDRGTGKIVHDIMVFENPNPEFCHPFNSYASPTPVLEAGRIYVHFGTYGTACLDTANGRILWTRRDLHCDHFRGPGSSPILYEDLLIVAFDGVDQQFIVALDKSTGRTVWKKIRDIDYKTDNGDFKKAYGTPTIVEVNGKPQLISSAAMATLAYEPRTGEEIWRVRHGGMNSAAPPQVGDGKVFLCTGSGGLGLVAVRAGGHGDVTQTHTEWKYSKAIPTRVSPLLVDDLIYLIDEKGVASCLEAKSGQPVWQQRLGGEFSASPILAYGHIYACSQEGLTHVLVPGRQPKVLAVNRLDEGFMASPAVADGALFLRTRTHLYRIQK